MPVPENASFLSKRRALESLLQVGGLEIFCPVLLKIRPDY